jgi:hypothetical protein
MVQVTQVHECNERLLSGTLSPQEYTSEIASILASSISPNLVQKVMREVHPVQILVSPCVKVLFREDCKQFPLFACKAASVFTSLQMQRFQNSPWAYDRNELEALAMLSSPVPAWANSAPASARCTSVCVSAHFCNYPPCFVSHLRWVLCNPPCVISLFSFMDIMRRRGAGSPRRFHFSRRSRAGHSPDPEPSTALNASTTSTPKPALLSHTATTPQQKQPILPPSAPESTAKEPPDTTSSNPAITVDEHVSTRSRLAKRAAESPTVEQQFKRANPGLGASDLPPLCPEPCFLTHSQPFDGADVCACVCVRVCVCLSVCLSVCLCLCVCASVL